METKTVVKDDYGYTLNFVFKDDTGTVVDLSGLTVTFKMRLINSTTVFLSKTCVIDVAASGTCHYNVVDGDMSNAGIYTYELEATDSATKLYTAIGDKYIEIVNSI